jgi:hypothetical protein
VVLFFQCIDVLPISHNSYVKVSYLLLPDNQQVFGLRDYGRFAFLLLLLALAPFSPAIVQQLADVDEGEHRETARSGDGRVKQGLGHQAPPFTIPTIA